MDTLRYPNRPFAAVKEPTEEHRKEFIEYCLKYPLNNGICNAVRSERHQKICFFGVSRVRRSS